MKNIFSWILLLYIAVITNGEENPYIKALKQHPWKSVQKYVEVRPGVHLFYWLYYADGTILRAKHKPLLIWIQGGPGLAASGIANFAEIGPLDMDFNLRNHTWVNGRNLLLIDHPAGAGFSYVTDKSLYVKSDREAAVDLSRMIRAFFRRHKEFRKTPSYVFGQSYGGKLLPRLAYYLHTAITNDRLKMNFKGIGIGSGWVDPKESTLIQPDFLYNMVVLSSESIVKVDEHHPLLLVELCATAEQPEPTAQPSVSQSMLHPADSPAEPCTVDDFFGTGIAHQWNFSKGVIDQSTYYKTKDISRKMANCIDRKDYSTAGRLEDLQFKTLSEDAGMELNFNNINQISPYPELGKLVEKVNKYVKPTLSHVVDQSMDWNYESDEVFLNLNESFLIPSTKFLEMLLNKTKLKIAVYNGNLDVITPLAGASNWAHKLRWYGAVDFKNAKRYKIRGNKNGFYKATEQFSFWGVFGSGHWVPEDNPVAMEEILEHVLKG